MAGSLECWSYPGRDRADGRERRCSAVGAGRTWRRIPASPGAGPYLAAPDAAHQPTPARRATDGASALPARAGGGGPLATVAQCLDSRSARRTRRKARDPDGVPGAVRGEAALRRRRRRHDRNLPPAGARGGAAATARTAHEAGLSPSQWELCLVEGDASRRIVEHEQSRDCDLVVLAPRGRSAAEDLLLGSVTRHVLAEGQVDVLVSTLRGG